MSPEQERALWEAGSFVERTPPVMERASTRTALEYADIVADALSTKQVAALLGVSEGRVRQRAGDRSLYAIRGNRLLFPRFQFTDGGEIPGWSPVAPRFPDLAYPVAVVRFMSSAHPDLQHEAAAMSPVEWLRAGGSPGELADLVDDTFAPVGM